VCKGRPPIFAFSSLKKIGPTALPSGLQNHNPTDRCRHHSPLLAALDFVFAIQAIPTTSTTFPIISESTPPPTLTSVDSVPVDRQTSHTRTKTNGNLRTPSPAPPTTTTTLSLPRPSTMASPSVQNPPTAAASKAPKKKKGKSESTESPAPASATPEKAASAAGDNQDDVSDAPHIRELKK